MPGWNSPLILLRDELVQRRDEGCQVPPRLLQRFAEFHPESDKWNPRVEPLYDEIMALPADPQLEAQEPNELQAIRALRPPGPRVLAWSPGEAELVDRFHGAWTGRAAGCALGKPVEGMGCTGWQTGTYLGRPLIKSYLSKRGDWPLRDFFSGTDLGDGNNVACPLSTREQIAFMEPDDDIHYSLVGLGVIERNGPDFGWEDVAKFWLGSIPLFHICTAENQAVLNYQMRTCRWDGCATPAFTRRFQNPYREFIGAQIRSDGWAWTCAGKPELAAEFAWRDAMWTHERNGIYGEMLFAAIQAAAFVERDPRKLVEIGLSEIPRACRLALLIRQCLAWADECRDWESCMASLEAACPGMNPIHTINNAGVCVLSLIYGRMDTVDSIGISVMCALDTDCNGATVGSIVGAASGRKAFRREFSAKLNDTIKPAMVGFQEVTMADLATRTLAAWRTVDDYHRRRTGAVAAAAKA